MYKRLSRLMTVLVGLSLSAFAAAQSLYQVELIIFERKGLVRTLGVGQASDGRNLSYFEDSQPLKAQHGDTTQAAPMFTLLDESELSLATQAASLERSKQMRVLVHQAWRQPVGRQPVSVALAGGAAFGPWHELAGSIQLTLNKSLQLNSILWFAHFMPDNGHPITNPISIPLPPEQGPLSDAKTDGFFATLAVPFSFKQNLKPGVITYVDHPIFGLIIKVQPL